MKHVAVIGSGASGLAAAFAAAQAGARVSVYEAHEKLGGTTALSGGNAWLPAHAALEDDSPEPALAYLRALALGDADDEMLKVFAYQAGPTAERLQRDTPLRLQAIPYCDYHAEFEGGRPQGGRSLEPQPYDPSDEVRELLRDAPNITGPITYVELATGEIDRELLAERRAKGTITLGRALLAGLLQACLDLGVDLHPGTRVRELPDADAVVLATGGFERDPELAKHFLRGPMLGPVGAPTAPRRRAADGDQRRRSAGQHERGLVVPVDLDPRGDDRRRADVPPDPRRTCPGGLADRRRERPPVRQRGAELQRLRAHTAELQSRGVPVPPCACLDDLRQRRPHRLPPRSARAPGPRPGMAGARRDGGRAGARHRGRHRGAWRRRSSVSTPARAPARTPTSAAAATRTTASSASWARSATVRTSRSASFPDACPPRVVPRPTPTVGCCRSPTERRSRACTPPATSPRAASGWPIRAPGARSARRSCSGCAPATPRLRTESAGSAPAARCCR